MHVSLTMVEVATWFCQVSADAFTPASGICVPAVSHFLSALGFVSYSHLSHSAVGGVSKVPFCLTLMSKEVDHLSKVDQLFGELVLPDEAMYSSFQIAGYFS